MSRSCAEPRRLLIRGVNWLGDAVMTEPAISRLRARWPGAEIALLTLESLTALWDGHPALDQVVSFRRGESWFTLGRRLRAEGFDTALVLPNSPRSALEAWAARIPRRVGVRGRWRSAFLTETLPNPALRMEKRRPSVVQAWARKREGAAMPRPDWGPADHHTRHYLALGAALGASPEPQAPRLHLAPGEAARLTEEVLKGLGLNPPPPPWLALNPGAAYGPAKQWPEERFAAVGRLALQRGAGAVWVLGGPGDEPAGEALARQVGPGAWSLAGRTSLRSLMAMLSSCGAVLTNDSGPMHLAVALGTSVVAIFGSTSPELTAPGSPGNAGVRILRSTAGCAPCFLRRCPIDLRCQLGIGVDVVGAATLAALDI